MNKWIYNISGLFFIISSFVLLSWFISDFSYGIQHITNPMYFARIFSPILCLYFGIFYLYCGINNKRINNLSDLSIKTLIGSLVFSIILMLANPIYTGGPMPLFARIIDSIWRLAMPLGIITSFILSILSIFKK